MMRTVNLMNSVACVVGALLLAGLATDANAAITSVCLSATAAEPSEVANATYGNGSCSAPFGVGLNYSPSDSSTLATNPSPMPLELTTAGFDLTSFGDGVASFASVETGSLHVAASSDGESTQANGTALFGDGLAFTITDGAPMASIPVHIHLQGSQTDPFPHSYDIGFNFNFANASFAYYTRSSPPGFGYPPCCGPTGFATLTDTLTDSGIDIIGTVIVTDGEITSIQTSLTADCRAVEACDYTATFNWDLPSNVTVTSDSGVFLSQPGGSSSLP